MACQKDIDHMPPSFFDLGQRVLLRRIKSNAKDLTEIDLVDVNLGPKVTCKLLDALHENNVVKTLWLSGNAMGDRGAVALADLLKANCNICQVILGLNEIGATGAVAISEALMEDGAVLDVLCMGGNFGVGDLGASAIGRALGKNTSLIELWLRDNGIGIKGAQALADGLRHNVTLKQQWLGGNDMGDEGAAALANAIRSSGTISIMDLSNNGISDVGASSLRDALERNFSIVKLDLSGNNITASLLKDIEELVCTNNKRAKEVRRMEFTKKAASEGTVASSPSSSSILSHESR